MRLLLVALTVFSFTLIGCKNKTAEKPVEKEVKPMEVMEIEDPHSYSEPNNCIVTHLDLDLHIDFNDKILSGVASWNIDNKRDAKEIIFDTKKLSINKVWLDDGVTTTYELGEANETFGQPLKVAVQPSTQVVHIEYTTDPDAGALMWLEPSQTQGKEHPFFFTQSQAILARTWLPCQDGPGVRYTYNAKVKTPEGLIAVMSAENPTATNEDNIYSFEMTQPVPSYLMALVVADLEFRDIGDRTGVYAEPAMIDAAEYELGEMQTMLEKAEALYGPYRWERYDVVFLPPSFPFGGMENPRLTFATPTIITGDRSLTALIAHELAHSWSGNLVTNATWDDFWLNEGFTVYFEQRIMEEVYGRDFSEMLALLSFQGLLGELEQFEADGAMEDTHLKLDMTGRDPDEGMSAIAYDKGYLFLRMLEENYGRERFDAFLKKYFQENSFKVMTTEVFLTYLNDHLLSQDPAMAKTCQVDAWVYGPGLPENCPVIRSEKLEILDTYLKGVFEDGNVDFADIDTTGWTPQEFLYFAANVPKDIDASMANRIDAHFRFTTSTNSEILGQWFKVVARLQYEPAMEAMESFLVRVGRRKFLEPIYKALVAQPSGIEIAEDIYSKAKVNYHAVARETIEEIIEEALKPYEKEQNKD